MRLAFCWQGLNGRYGQWKDGLWAAMQLIEEEHEVRYFDFPLTGIHEFKPDVVLYWEAPVTQRGKDAANWKSVCELPYPKALLFAGGPLKAIDVKDFDLVFTESQINDEDCEREGIPYKRAFGVNTQIMRPLNLEKKWDGIIAATFADWKRHALFADSLLDKGLAVGRLQVNDRNGYERCLKQGVEVMDEVAPEKLAELYNQSHVAVNTSEYWGGGQRMTLEAMACGIPVIVMSDSPKNCEYVLESGAGMICDPNTNSISSAIEHLKNTQDSSVFEHGSMKCHSATGLMYIALQWTEHHYADNLLTGIKSII